MDESIRIMYQMLHRLDPGECIGLVGRIADFRVDLKPGVVPLPEFLRRSAQAVTLDEFSTKDRAKQHPEFAHAYIEMHRTWYLLRHAERPVGYADVLQVYNAWPTLIDPERFANDPNGVLERGMERLLQEDDPRVMLIPPVVSRRMRVHLHEEFYRSHLVLPQ